MQSRYTFIAVPSDVTDPMVLRRFLDKLVEQIDVAFSNRGDGGFASFTSTATTIEGLKRDINKFASQFVLLDSSNLEEELRYKTQPTPTPLGLATNQKVDELIEVQTAPSQLPSTATLLDVIDKINELIISLQNSRIMV